MGGHPGVRALLTIGAILLLGGWAMADTVAEPAKPAVTIRDFVPEDGVVRAERATVISAVLENAGGSAIAVSARLVSPGDVRIVRSEAEGSFPLDVAESRRLSWTVEAGKAAEHTFRLEVLLEGSVIGSSTLDLRFLPPMPVRKLAYVPEPEPVHTRILVGAHNCPLWEADKPEMWSQIRKHPERTPALGFYAQENPEVADWETKWAVEHGISFFIYCWYRASQGEPVKMMFSSAIDALMKSRFRDRMKFTIMWENQSKGRAGVADEKDLMTNLLPFWMENYFKHPSYLKIDNKPVLFIYRPEFLVDDLGSVENVAKAFEKMRRACRDAGFDGLYILGEYRGLDSNHLKLMKQLGLDYSFAYCWPIGGNPTPQQAVEAQMGYINSTQKLGILPQVVTVSQAWSGWSDEGTIWKIPPTEFEGLLTRAKEFVGTLPANQLGSRMLLLDNWNEWGEGHYIAPYREYGFGYLDAVRGVFSDAPEKHTDLIPQDIGLGPYDTAYREWDRGQELSRRQVAKKATKPGADEPGLVAWWAFDEADGATVALDYSGHRLGGIVKDAGRVKGIEGSALECKGGCVVVPSSERLSPTDAMTIECWVRTDAADQSDKWMANRIYGGVTDSGYRFGLAQGRLCFAIPQTDWSHHLAASRPLPLGRWVHVAGTYDGKMMRVYMDGEECGSLERTGPTKSNDRPLCLGSFDQGHAAHFTGELDEVKLYDRALTADEVRAHARKSQ